MNLKRLLIRKLWTQIQTFVSVLLVIMIVHQAILSTTHHRNGKRVKHDFHALSAIRPWGVDVCAFPFDQDPETANGCIIKNENHVGRSVQGVEGYPNCLFFRENFDMASCLVEKLTHDAVKKIIEPEDVVLEIGSRWDIDQYVNHS